MSLEAAGIGALTGIQGLMSVTQLAGGFKQADTIRQLASRDAQAVIQAQNAENRFQRRADEQVQGRLRARVAASGFTTRGSPLEMIADTAASQMEMRLIRRHEARTTAQNIKIRSEFQAEQAEAQGISSFFETITSAGSTVLSRIAR